MDVPPDPSAPSTTETHSVAGRPRPMACLGAVWHRRVGTHFPVVRGVAIGCHARQYPNRQDSEDLAPTSNCQDGPTDVNQGNSIPAPPVTQPSLQKRAGASLTCSPGSHQQSFVKTKHMPTSKAASQAGTGVSPSLSEPFSIPSYITKCRVCGSQHLGALGRPSALLPGLVQSSLS